MPTFLFSELVFGPLRSRRFGHSLGINLLPTQAKFCNFDCVYCECGWSHAQPLRSLSLPTREQVQVALQEKLIQLQKDAIAVDSITFAGNGEPTIHPRFAEIIDDTILLRDRYYPQAKVSVLTNAAVIHKTKVFYALLKTDLPVLKLDAGSEEMFQLIDRPAKGFSLDKLSARLQKFQGNCVLQTLFMRGSYEKQALDNTSENEIKLWLERVKKINPRFVMIYSIARDTPAPDLQIISKQELEHIAERVRAQGIDAQVYD